MAERRTPTNTELLKQLIKELKDIKAMQTQQHNDISALQQWKVAEDAYRAALAKVREDDEKEKFHGLRDDVLKRRTELLKQIGIVVGLLVAILYAYAATHGVNLP